MLTSTVWARVSEGYNSNFVESVHTLPPKTSSPIIKHAAVFIVLEYRSSRADDDVIMLLPNVLAAECCA
jgi:hypothetical protein